MVEADIDPRLVAALRRQLAARRGGRVGWKLGLGERERIGDELVVGNLKTAARLEPGSTFELVTADRLHADAEVAVEIGEDGQIAGYAAAVELVDLDSAPSRAEDIVAENIFHCAFAIGAAEARLPPHIEARLVVNSDVRATGRPPNTFAERVRVAAKILSTVGQQLEPGDWIITGSVVQAALHRGDEVVADFGPLGRVGLKLA